MPQSVGLRKSVVGTKNNKGKGGGGWNGSWTDRFDTGKTKAEAQPIMLTRGSYPMKGKERDSMLEQGVEEPNAHYHTMLSHGVKLRASGPGSYFSARCNEDAGDEECVMCFASANGDKRVTTRYTYSFNMVHFGIFQLVPKLDRDGKPIRSERDTENYERGDVILEFQQVTKPRDLKEIMKNIDAYLDDGAENIEGGICLAQKKYLEVGTGHRDQIVEIDAKAAELCRCGGNLTPMEFECEKCGEVLINIAEDNLEPAEAQTYANSRQRCGNCGHVGLPVSVPECDSCDDPIPLTAFDVVAYIRKKGENQSSRIEVERVIPLTEFELADGSPIIEWDEDDQGDFPLEAEITDEEGNITGHQWVFTEYQDIKKLADAQWDFEKVHRARDHAYIADRLGIRVPSGFSESKAANLATSGYGAKKAKYKKYGSTSTAADESTETTTRRGRSRTGSGRVR